MASMEAVHQAGWGGREQLSLRTVPRPTATPGSVLVRVVAVSVHAGDHHMLTGRPYLVRVAIGRREIPGMDFAGVVEDASGDFAAGDRVFGTADMACGAFAEFVCVPAAHVVRIPPDVSFTAAAAVPTSGMTALQALRLGRGTASGDRVLVNGASGGVGTFAVQLAKSMGAHVTGVCSSRNVTLVQDELGADEVIDYTKQDPTDAAEPFDRILDLVGNHGPAEWLPLLKDDGALVAVTLPNPESECVPCQLLSVACFPWCCSTSCFSVRSQKFYTFMQEVSTADLEELASMLRDGTLVPAVAQSLSGMAAIPDALSGHSGTLGLGHTKGKTVITIGGDAAEPSP